MSLSDNLHIDTPGQTITDWDLDEIKESIKELKKEMWKDCDKWEENINKIFGDALCVKTDVGGKN